MNGGDANAPWPRLQEFIECGGQLSIGRIGPIACAAVASDEDQLYVSLVRRDGESFTDLLTRLDTALADALDNENHIDERMSI